MDQWGVPKVRCIHQQYGVEMPKRNVLNSVRIEPVDMLMEDVAKCIAILI